MKRYELEDDTHKAPIESSLGEYCRNLYEEYSGSVYRQKKTDEIHNGRKRYNADLPAKDFPWPGCSNITLGLEAIAVDNIEPRLKNQLIAEDEFIQVIPTGPEDVEKADGVKDFLHWAMQNNMCIEEKIKPFVHDLVLDGTKDVIPLWEEKTKKIKIRTAVPVFVGPDGQEVPLEILKPYLQQPDGMQMLQQFGIQQAGMKDTYSEREETEFKVDLELINISESYFPDTGDDFDEQPYLRFIYPTLKELEDASGENGPYKNIDGSLLVDPGRTSEEYPDVDRERKQVKFSEFTKQVKLLECYVKWNGEWVIASFATDAAWREVRLQKLSDVYWHGRKPVRRFRLFPETNESMGVGFPTKIKQYSVGVDSLFNTMVDNATITTMPFGFINEGKMSGLETAKKVIKPGDMIPIPEGAGVTFPTFNQNQGQLIAFMNLLMSFFEKVTSLSDYTLGRQSSIAGKGGETFSGMNMIVQEGNIKHQYQGSSLRDQFSELLKDVLSLYAQYMPMDAKKRVFENNEWIFQPLDVLSIQGSYDVKVQVSDASANKMLNRKEKVELTNILGGNPIIDIHKITTDLLQAYGKKRPDEYIKPEFSMVMQAVQAAPEITQMIQQYMQQKTETERKQQIAGEAQANVERQEIERQVEQPVEDRKLIDQVSESVKREMIKPGVEAVMTGRLLQ